MRKSCAYGLSCTIIRSVLRKKGKKGKEGKHRDNATSNAEADHSRGANTAFQMTVQIHDIPANDKWPCGESAKSTLGPSALRKQPDRCLIQKNTEI